MCIYTILSVCLSTLPWGCHWQDFTCVDPHRHKFVTIDPKSPRFTVEFMLFIADHQYWTKTHVIQLVPAQNSQNYSFKHLAWSRLEPIFCFVICKTTITLALGTEGAAKSSSQQVHSFSKHPATDSSKERHHRLPCRTTCQAAGSRRVGK